MSHKTNDSLYRTLKKGVDSKSSLNKRKGKQSPQISIKPFSLFSPFKKEIEMDAYCYITPKKTTKQGEEFKLVQVFDVVIKKRKK